MPNKRGLQIVRGWEIFRKSNKRGGPNKRGGQIGISIFKDKV